MGTDYQHHLVVKATLDNFLRDATQPAVLPPPTALVPPESLQVTASYEEAVAATASVIASADRLLTIFSPDLEPRLFEHPDVVEATKHFILSHRFAKARILVRQTSHARDSFNVFSRMAIRLTSYMEVRVIQRDRAEILPSYCIADDHALVYRLRSDRWDGITTMDNPAIARAHLASFDQLWPGAQYAMDFSRSSAGLR